MAKRDLNRGVRTSMDWPTLSFAPVEKSNVSYGSSSPKVGTTSRGYVQTTFKFDETDLDLADQALHELLTQARAVGFDPVDENLGTEWPPLFRDSRKYGSELTISAGPTSAAAKLEGRTSGPRSPRASTFGVRLILIPFFYPFAWLINRFPEAYMKLRARPAVSRWKTLVEHPIASIELTKASLAGRSNSFGGVSWTPTGWRARPADPSQVSRCYSFFQFEASDRDEVFAELTDFATNSGIDLVNELSENELGLAKYRGTDKRGFVMTVTMSERRIGVELRTKK